jgi:hypothetical protein
MFGEEEKIGGACVGLYRRRYKQAGWSVGLAEVKVRANRRLRWLVTG